MVRLTCSGRSTSGGSGTAVFELSFFFSEVRWTFETNEKLVIFCFSPFSYISISSGLRSRITFPFLSVTETSIWIRAVDILTTLESSVGGVGDGSTVCPEPARTSKRIVVRKISGLTNRSLLRIGHLGPRCEEKPEASIVAAVDRSPGCFRDNQGDFFFGII